MPGRAGTSLSKRCPPLFSSCHTRVRKLGADEGAECREVIETYGELVGQKIFYVGVTPFLVSISTTPGTPLASARRAWRQPPGPHTGALLVRMVPAGRPQPADSKGEAGFVVRAAPPGACSAAGTRRAG